MSIDSEKFIGKYLRLAKQFGEDCNPCYSRNIGCVYINPLTNSVSAMGFNGPPRKAHHCDDPEYLTNVVWPELTREEKRCALEKHIGRLPLQMYGEQGLETFLKHYSNCKECPRRIVGAPSGTRYELCSCIHAEVNGLINRTSSLRGSWLFIWGGAPCWECAKVLVQNQVAKIICTEGYIYTRRAKFLLDSAGIEVVMYPPDKIVS